MERSSDGISEWAAINNGADQRNDGHATKLMRRDAGFYFCLKDKVVRNLWPLTACDRKV